MKEENPQVKVEEVQNQQDLALLERFHKSLDTNDPIGLALGFFDD
jgi:hypothetical protein